MGIADLGPKSNLILNADIIVKAYEAPQAKDHLSILSYNIGFGVGPVQVTVGETKPRSEFLHNLDEIARVVEETSADILLLQEVDLNSRRSHYLNQLHHLQERLAWPYAAYTTTWKTYVPFDKIGKVHECAAILSRYPILKNEARVYQFEPQHKNRLFNLLLYLFFVWKSVIQYGQVEYRGRKINLFNLHLDVFSRANRALQIQALIDWIKHLELEKNLIFGGDLNYHAELGRERKTDFRGYDPNLEKLPPFFVDVWQALPGIREAFIQEDSNRDQIHQQVTYPELAKRHDFVFFSSEFEYVSSTVVDNISSSDHLPVHVVLKLRD